jgi:spermidine synthase
MRPVCADAFAFIKADRETYDLIIVDLFFGREVPEAVTSSDFLQQCKARLQPGGHLVLNYMVNRREEEEKAKAALEAAFENVQEISFGINKVYIASQFAN